jgi:hypothetical protein
MSQRYFLRLHSVGFSSPGRPGSHANERRQRDRAALADNPAARRMSQRHAPALAELTPAPDPDAAERAARIAALADAALKRRLDRRTA